MKNVSSHLLIEVWPFVCVVMTEKLSMSGGRKDTDAKLFADGWSKLSASFPKQQHVALKRSMLQVQASINDFGRQGHTYKA